MEKYILNREEVVLLIIDIQERLVSAMKYGKQVIEKTSMLLSAAEEMNIPILATEQYPKGLGKTVVELDGRLDKARIFEKNSFTAYTEEIKIALEETKRKKVIITGMETHVCVFQTVRDLLADGYQVFILNDGVCSRTKNNHLNGLSLMQSMGAVITNTESVLFDLLKISGTPEFKVLSKLIK
ncbi:isochorismatase family protein [Tissierella sp. MSJ-40]|uniref:Isochorismatase family protein n=1 Tax=Tissierella simiarum TaxID=2841534 RepID=A0ABS6E7N9_9FIRM|nr:isochorismatase family protein [Tissierella simiarum]MBU5438931.1 isochorismatase family protein [Tissierella simiarum]